MTSSLWSRFLRALARLAGKRPALVPVPVKARALQRPRLTPEALEWRWAPATDLALTLSGPNSVNEGAPYVLNLSASGSGAATLDHWTINWGDGSSPQTFPGSATSASHTYADGTRSYTILATATNADGTFDAHPAGGSVLALDPTFGDGGRVTADLTGSTSDAILDLLTQPDGKVIGAGYSQAGSSDVVLVRYNADGSLDPTFGSGGKVVTDFGGYEVAYALGRDAAGRLLVGGNFGLARYSADGVLDTGFGDRGRITGVGQVNQLIIDHAGRIVVNGGYSLSRLNQDGSFDPSFDGDGRVDNFANYFDSLAVDAGNGVYVTSNVYNGADYDVVVTHYTAGGALDTAFGPGGADGDGRVTLAVPGRDEYVVGLAAAADGVVVVGGTNPQPDPVTGSYGTQSNDLYLTRLTATGALDPTFAGGGTVRYDFGGWDYPSALLVDGTGRLVVGGQFGLARFSASGQLDGTFGSGGRATRRVDDIQALAEGPGGALFAGGSVFNGATGSDLATSRYKAAGQIDNGFGGGRVTTDFVGSTSDGVRDLVLTQPDGKVLVVGYKSGGTTDLVISRYLADGTPDLSFGGTGTVEADLTTYDQPSQVLVDGAGRILVGGTFGVARYLSDGTRDTTFGNNGVARHPQLYEVTSLALDAAGRVVAGGYTYRFILGTAGSTQDFAVARFTESGQVDLGFGTAGLATADFGTSSSALSDESVRGLAIDAGGNIVVVGISRAYRPGTFEQLRGYDFAVARFTGSGTLDTTFAGTGQRLYDFGSDEYANVVRVDSSGRLLVGGYLRVVGLTADGSLDPTFSGGSVFVGANVEDLAIDADGRLVLATGSYLVRLNGDGSSDTSFAPGGSYYAGASGYFSTVSVDGGGRLVVGGNAEGGTRGTDFVIARYVTGGLSVNVLNVNPQIVSVTVPGTATEGATVALQASATDAAGDADPLSYGWTVYRNGSLFAQLSGADASFTAHDNGNYQVFLSVSDGDGGFASASRFLFVTNAAPTATFVAPADADEGTAFTLWLTGAADASPTDEAAGFTYAFDFGGGYGPWGTDNIASFTPADNGVLTVRGKVRDKDGAVTEYTATVTVYNLAPVISGVTNSGPADEGTPVTVTVAAGDPAGASDTLRYEFDFDNDGVFEVGPQAGNSAAHQFAGHGSFTVNVRVTDEDGGVTTGATAVTVNNVAPSAVQVNGPSQAVPGQEVTFTGTYTDPSAEDTHTLTWVVMDGSGNAVASGSGESFAFTPAATGTYTVTLTVTDGAGASSSGSAQLSVVPAVLQDDPLFPGGRMLVVGGTSGADLIVVNRGTGGVGVAVSYNGTSAGEFVPTTRVVVYGLAGNDYLGVGTNVTSAAWLFGGDGNDTLIGGAGDDVLVGGDGNDLLSSSGGQDVLIGGRGADRLSGSAGDKLMIAGFTRWDADEAALAAISGVWASGAGYQSRVDTLREQYLTTGPTAAEATVFDDNAADTVMGGRSMDWFFANLSGGVRDTLAARSYYESLDELLFDRME